MPTTTSWPKTLQEAVVYFANIDRAQDFLVAMRWPDGVACPTCGNKELSYVTTRRLWKCRNEHPNQRFSIKKGSIMEDSPIGLDKWMTAMWLLGNCKNGISSYEVARDLKVSQQTAWFMLQRLRLGMQQGSFEKMGGGGPVEADETFIGGLARNMRKHIRAKKITGTGGAGKELVMGLLDRETGKVRVKHVANRKRGTLQEEIKTHVAPGAEVFTDELASYTGLDKEFVHDFVNHAEQYVKGNVHTNGMENFWSLLKRMIKGTYVSVEPFHLFRYLDEEAFRFNERKHEDGDRGRFMALGRAIFGKRLMYKQLIGQMPALATT
ncbi:MAG TPA: IS1595 family transposase [Candidatus Acidoferrales bacterium]|nr:IS1595 family transposase [Candidatus Acidoferrales bacterium]